MVRLLRPTVVSYSRKSGVRRCRRTRDVLLRTVSTKASFGPFTEFSTAGAEQGVYLENAFIRQEQGRHYVYLRGADGKLEKRYVSVGKSLWGSYKQILSGITEEDMLAFPYGKNLKEGADTLESDLSALYE